MLTKRTVIDQIEMTRRGVMQVRLLKLIEENGVPITDGEYHRTSIAPTGDPVAQMADVNRNLEAMNFAPLPADDVAWIASAHAALVTPEQAAAYTAAVAAMNPKRDTPAPR